MEMDGWIIALGRKCQYLKSLNIGAVVLHFDRDQTTAAVPFRSVDEGERGREGMKRKQEQVRIQIKLVKIGQGLSSLRRDIRLYRNLQLILFQTKDSNTVLLSPTPSPIKF